MVKLQNKTESGETIKNRIEKLLEETDPPNGLKDAGETIDIAQKNNEEPSNKVLQATNQKQTFIDENDALRILSSEVSVKRLIGDDAVEVGTLPFDVIFDRTLDTIEDAIVHARRIPHDVGWEDVTKISEVDNRPTVVVLGSGWGAHAFMKIADTNKVKLIVVSPSNHFVFTPMLASAAVGTVEYRSMTESVRAANPMIEEYVEGKATDIDVEKKIITVKLNNFLKDVAKGESPTIEIPYDRLLVSVGTKVNDKVVPGAKEYGLRLKSVEDARRLRTAVGESFEYASRPDAKKNQEERRRRITFMLVGGGPTGVELAGELSDFCRDITNERVGTFPNLREDFHLILVHGGPELLPPFEANLRKHALEALEKRGVEVRLDTRVQEVGDGFVRLLSTRTGEEETVPVGLTVWAAGNRPVGFVDTLLNQLPESARGAGGRVAVDKYFRCPTKTPETFGSIFVLGDACCFTEGPEATLLPQTAQVAGQEGAYVARLMNRGYDLSTTPPRLPETPSSEEARVANIDATLNAAWLKLRGLDEAQGFRFLNLGILAYVGGGEALSQVELGDVPIFSYAGSVAFILWRSVYLVKQVATRNRVLVTFDWIKSALFGRDITRL
jgi:NADH dehydrogenase FAD-containing subunit